jgi:exopolysaccharide biosynthesis WecB/TagA/CpsF family protein
VFSLVLTILATLAGLVLAAPAIYLLTLTAASFFYRPRRGDAAPGHRLVVLVPAHDEAELIQRCVASLKDQSYPSYLYRIVVIADNCSDQTASLAEEAGAEVMLRHLPGRPGKGRALRWAMDRILAACDGPDAIVVVDADSVAHPDLLRELESHLSAGAQVVQAEYLIMAEVGSTGSELVQAAFLLFHRTRFRGRAVLGMPAFLTGNGMLFARSALQSHPWDAYTSVEDLEYSINLRLAGIRPSFAGEARVAGPLRSGRHDARGQRMRWEGGRFHIVRSRLVSLVTSAVRRREWSLLDAAVDLAVPPLGLLTLAVAAWTMLTVIAAATHAISTWALLPPAVAVVSIVAYILLGLAAAGARPGAYGALLKAPYFLAWKGMLYGRLILHGHEPGRWEQHHRKADRSSRRDESHGRFRLVGVPLDEVGLDGAVARLRGALGTGRLLQVVTINTDFLVRAQTDQQIRRIFEESSLNLADGAPVVWLARLLGRRLPGRVAGADLVPQLMGVAAEHGAGVFMLGGEDGAAWEAAQNLQQMFPGLVIAGCYEPPRAPIEGMANDDILRQIEASGADILLVALGHPKQERWIDLHRSQLQVSVAIGVGCVFDLLAGRTHRAPQWMRRSGLEWLYRLVSQPRRLAHRYATDAGWLPVLAARALADRVAANRRLAG